jgi:class 3 adenylate cyclase
MNLYSIMILLLTTRFSSLLFVEKLLFALSHTFIFFGVQMYYAFLIQDTTPDWSVAEEFSSGFEELTEIVLIFVQLHSALLLVFFVSDYRCEHHNRREFLRLSAAEQKYAEMLENSNFSEQLLKRMPLPEQIIDQLRMTNQVKSTFIDGYGTVLFADIVSFTTFSQTLSAPQLVIMLNAMFMKFDRLAEKNKVVKIKTIGDCYVCASGVLSPMLGSVNHAEAMVNMAIDMHRAMQQINEEFRHGLRLRIGLHSGVVLGGIMGTKKLNFDLWGETVEMANKMEECGVPERIHVSETTFVDAHLIFEIYSSY